MKRKRQFRILLGIGIWLLAAIGLTKWAKSWQEDSPQDAQWQRGAKSLQSFALGERREVVAWSSYPAPVQKGDPIFVLSNGKATQIGEVTYRADLASDGSVAAGGQTHLLFYAHAPPLSQNQRLVYYQSPSDMEWVMDTMLPSEKRMVIASEISLAYSQHQEEIIAAVQPVVMAALIDVFAVVEEDLPTAIANHEDKLRRLGEKYQRTLVKDEIVPLVQTEVWPIVQDRAMPVAEMVGKQIWERASLWRFGWRYAYDQLPWAAGNLTQEEWKRFMSDDVMPVLDDNSETFVALQQQILVDIASNQQVREVIRTSLGTVITDEQFQTVVWSLVKEAIVDNPRVHEVLQEHWQSKEMQAAVSLAASKLEPHVRKVGEILLGSEQEGITPEFALVLRNQVLRKDQRWLILEELPAGAAVPVPNRPGSFSSQEHTRVGIDRWVHWLRWRKPADLHQLPLVRGGRPDVIPFADQVAMP
jgi:hypothetical protein